MSSLPDRAQTVNLPLDGALYRVRLDQGAIHDDTPMPDNPADHNLAVEQKLFLTPGGLYTQADIAANGNTMPSVKYADFVSTHNMHPQKGDRVCPITDTVANPKLTWVVGGKRYAFCCPPCLREFVTRAKTKPQSIRPPDAYVQR